MTITEPGCALFRIAQNKDKTDKLELWEILKSQSVQDAHLDMPYTKALFARNLIESVTVFHLTEMVKYVKRLFTRKPAGNAII